MKESLRNFLRSAGVSESDLDKLEKGEVPDDTAGVLRKSKNDTALAKCAACAALLEEIKQRLDRIERGDAHRTAAAKGVEQFTSGKMNGHTGVNGVNLALAALSKGQ
jgi:hypothetical protein